MATGSILIYNGKVCNGSEFIEGNVFVKDGIIDYIGKDYLNADYEYDAQGYIVSPGLIDSHIHMQGISPDIYGTPAEMSCFPFGVTSAADAGAIHINTNLLDSFSLNTLVFASVGVYNNKPDFTNTEKLLKEYGERIAGIKITFDSEGGVYDISPLAEVCNFAAHHNLKVLVHSTGSPTSMAQLLSCLKEGDICTHIYHGGNNSAIEDNFESLKDARKRGVILDAGMAGGVHTDFNILQKAIEMGVLPDTVSSDITSFSAFTRGGRYGLTMCMGIMRSLGMNENDLLMSVTSTPAKVLGKEDEWGTLAGGRKADIAVLAYTDEKIKIGDRWGHCHHSDKSYRCKLTVCNGKVVYKD